MSDSGVPSGSTAKVQATSAPERPTKSAETPSVSTGDQHAEADDSTFDDAEEGEEPGPQVTQDQKGASKTSGQDEAKDQDAAPSDDKSKDAPASSSEGPKDDAPASHAPEGDSEPSIACATVPKARPPTLSLPEDLAKAVQSKVAAGTGVILGVAVVDFNHLVGPQVEYTHPAELMQDEGLCSTLPFLALPDGSHLSDEDFCYFHLVASTLSDSTIFGISCNRQIASELLAVRGKEVTRSTVQKAVVVLAREPVFGPIREKLGVVTRAFFAQGDLSDTSILSEFHATLEAGLRSARGEPSEATTPVDGDSAAGTEAAEKRREQAAEESAEREATMYMGTSLRELVYKWRFKTLMLLKLLLLQRKIMFFGYPIERLCTYQYSLVSLVPGLLLALQDAGSPAMDRESAKRRKAESLRMSDRKSMFEYLGFPLLLFGKGAFFQPYLPLQQIDMATKAQSFLVGTSNSIFKQQKDCEIDCIVDLEATHIEFLDPRLQQMVQLTPADRKWMDELVSVVSETWNAADPTRPTSMQYVGSDDYLRAKFEGYITSMLSSIKYSAFLAKARKDDVGVLAPDEQQQQQQHGSAGVQPSAFGNDFLTAFKGTEAFATWDSTTDAMLFDLFDHKHPCEGKVSALEDVGLRITAGLHDLHIEEQLAPTREAMGKALQSGGQRAFQWANRLGNDLAKFRREQLAKAEAVGNVGMTSDGKEVDLGSDGNATAPAAAATSASSGSSLPSSPSPSAASGTSNGNVNGHGHGLAGTGVTTEQLQAQAQAAAAQAQAAALQAGTQVRAALGSFGNFLSARQKSWTAAASAAAANQKNAAGGGGGGGFFAGMGGGGGGKGATTMTGTGNGNATTMGGPATAGGLTAEEARRAGTIDLGVQQGGKGRRSMGGGGDGDGEGEGR